MNTKRIGNIGEAKVLAKFVELGIPVYIPFGENESADLIAEFNGKLQKVQVKTSTKYQEGYTNFNLVSTCFKGNSSYHHTYDETDIDYFALYSIPLDEIYLIHVNDSSSGSIRIRKEVNITKSIKSRNASECLIDNIITDIPDDDIDWRTSDN